MLESIDQTLDQLVNLVTLGQLQAIRDMYESWLATAGAIEPNILGYVFAFFVVLLRFIVPVVLFYYFIVRVIFKNYLLRIISVVIFSVVYALFYFDPIALFEEASLSVTKFYYFLKALPSIQTEPVFFTFLTNGLAVFLLRALVVVVSIFVFFIILIFLASVMFWIVTAGKSVWQYTEKNLKAIALQLTIIFLIFYPLLGALKSFATIVAVLIASINIKDAFYTIRGYQKVCYNIGEEVRCRWAK